ncbi:hypothetical protein BGZ76_005062 [Entomortierella beljakovae]|nr:hypothetical protein BGZ76_005062 [Entomortierella beljakovae]
MSSLSTTDVESPYSDGEVSQKKDTDQTTKDKVQPQQHDTLLDERKSAQFLNIVILPFDTTVSSGTSSSNNAATNAQQGKSALIQSNLLLQTAMSQLSFSINSFDILGASLKSPYHDIFGSAVQDQERWEVWTKGFRNKILSLSMRPQGGPALGPRNRPGAVSEREWLRYATRTWDTIRKADFLSEYVRAARLSREG